MVTWLRWPKTCHLPKCRFWLKTPNHHLIFRTNNANDYVVEQSSGLQVDNFSKVSGKEVFRDSQYMVTVCFSINLSECFWFPPQIESRISCQYLHCSCKDLKNYFDLVIWCKYFLCGPVKVYPVLGFPDPSVVQVSQQFVSDHQNRFSQTSRILQQVLIFFFQEEKMEYCE